MSLKKQGKRYYILCEEDKALTILLSKQITLLPTLSFFNVIMQALRRKFDTSTLQYVAGLVEEQQQVSIADNGTVIIEKSIKIDKEKKREMTSKERNEVILKFPQCVLHRLVLSAELNLYITQY